MRRVVVLLEQLDVAAETVVAGHPGVVRLVPQTDRLTEIDGQADADDVGGVGDEGGDRTGVLALGEIAGHADPQRHRRDAVRLEGAVEHADHAGRTLVRRPGEAERGLQGRVGRAADHDGRPGVRRGVGDGAERHDEVDAESFDRLDDTVDVRRPGDVRFDAFQDDEVAAGGSGSGRRGSVLPGHMIWRSPSTFSTVGRATVKS